MINAAMSPAKIREVPAFKKDEFASKKTIYALIVFVINEGERIQNQIKDMASFSNMIDIVIADGGSTDGSLRRTYLKRNGVRTLLTKTGEGKLSAQMRMAFSYTLEQGYRGVIVVDGSGKDDLEAIPRFITALDQGYDFIQGSRFIVGGRAINTPLSRLFGLRLIHAPLISLAAGYHYSDTTNGFRAYSSKLLQDQKINVFRDVFRGYELHYYLSIEAPRHGYKVTEIPVIRRYPKGRVPTKISPVRGNIIVLMTLLKVVLGKFRDLN
jgi:dolichol-phosphate mannosyltransferase